MPADGPWDGTIDLMIALRNVAIVALLAAAVMLLPGGGRITEAVFEALSLGFLTVIALAAYRFLRAEELTLLGMDDSRRAVFAGALGLLVLAIAGTGTLWGSGLTTLLWILMVGAAVVAIWQVWAAEKAA
jgi:hypothetical protein